jgi:hypothetical protein
VNIEDKVQQIKKHIEEKKIKLEPLQKQEMYNAVRMEIPDEYIFYMINNKFNLFKMREIIELARLNIKLNVIREIFSPKKNLNDHIVIEATNALKSNINISKIRLYLYAPLPPFVLWALGDLIRKKQSISNDFIEKMTKHLTSIFQGYKYTSMEATDIHILIKFLEKNIDEENTENILKKIINKEIDREYSLIKAILLNGLINETFNENDIDDVLSLNNVKEAQIYFFVSTMSQKNELFISIKENFINNKEYRKKIKIKIEDLKNKIN